MQISAPSYSTLEYSYPDHKDIITSHFTSQFQDYWIKSEKKILKIIKKIILSEKRGLNLKLLDFGCGEGRLIIEFNNLFSEIIGIDTDMERLNQAKILIGEDVLKKTQLINVSVDKLNLDSCFDVIIISHVLQHIPTHQIPIYLEKCFHLLKPNGLLFINTCHSTNNSDQFAVIEKDRSYTFKRVITRIEFNSLFDINAQYLPNHAFSISNLSKLLKTKGFKIEIIKVFHIINRKSPEKSSILTDILINLLPYFKRKNGTDLFIYCKKVP